MRSSVCITEKQLLEATFNSSTTMLLRWGVICAMCLLICTSPSAPFLLGTALITCFSGSALTPIRLLHRLLGDPLPFSTDFRRLGVISYTPPKGDEEELIDCCACSRCRGLEEADAFSQLQKLQIGTIGDGWPTHLHGRRHRQ